MQTVCNLTDKKCIPCEGGVEPFNEDQIKEYTSQIEGWEVVEEQKIKKKYKFNNFKQALEFVNKIGAVAEEEGHHPDILVFGWNKVMIMLSTHAIKGLSENDFIMAAKIDEVFSSSKL